LQLQQKTLKIGQDKLDMEEERQQEGRPTEDSKERAASEKNLADEDKVSYPETTTQMIGWKPQVLQRNKVERHARGKQDIVKLFKWPREGF